MEVEILDAVPPSVAGKAVVTLVSFAAMFVLWVLLLHRPSSDRLRKVAESGSSAAIEKCELATRTVSSIHAIVVSYTSYIYLQQRLANGPNMDRELQPEIHKTFEFYLAFSLGFFIGDSIICSVLFDIYGPAFLFHGLCVVFGFSWALWVHYEQELPLLMAANGLLWEASTPFLNNIYFFKMYLPRWKYLQLINGITLVAVFFYARLYLGMPTAYELIMILVSLRDKGSMGTTEMRCLVFIVSGLSALNVFWFFKLIRGFFRALMKDNKDDGKVTKSD